MTANSGSKSEPKPQETPSQARRKPIDLDYRYGEIGIVAVAAALRYSGTDKPPAEEPVAPCVDQRFIESAG